MFVLFGNRTRKQVEADGKFVCPNCKIKRIYEVINSRLWFTLFLIPIFPLEKRNDFSVRCKSCDRTYYTDVLDNNNYYLDGSPFSETKPSNLAKPDRVIKECPSCGTRLRLPGKKSGRVKCNNCGEAFETST